MSVIKGLTGAEVEERVNAGEVNVVNEKQGKSVLQIILSNTLTFFNLLNIVFFVLIISVGSYKNSLFMGVIIINTVIGIFQEVRTKKTLDSMKFMTASKALVVRDGMKMTILVEEIVKDDVLILRAGDQVPADCMVLQGEVEVNESMLTGESDNVQKREGAELWSGSFVTSGEAVLRVVHVGKDNYIETISGEAKKQKKVDSQLRTSINTILRAVSFFIVPLCAGLFCKMYLVNHTSFRSAVEQMVTSGIGMIPEGLFLLTSLSLTVGVLQLARKKTIVQELYCIETLARVDVLCLDKTGTLTEGKIRVEEMVTSNGHNVDELSEAFRNILFSQNVKNDTSLGLLEYFGYPDAPWHVSNVIPFSSDRKFSGAVFEGHGTYYMGAFQFLCPERKEMAAEISRYASEGMRCIVLAHSHTIAQNYALPNDLEPIGYVVMSDVIRKNCGETMQFFKEQGVALKVISGDDPATVSKIATICGVLNADKYVDVSTLQSDEELRIALRKCSVFGRVKPEQKRRMVQLLKEDGHTVAMTGDGVNDVLALKEANCSIAMASGSDAAKNTANIVLLNSDFTSLPSVVNEGRRVINNICNAAAMYLIKTTFSVILTIGTLIIGFNYPFQAVQLSVISGCAVGIPTFFLQLEPTYRRVKDNFMQTVFRNALAPGIVVALFCLLITNIGMMFNADNQAMLSTICVFCIGWIYFFMLKRIYSPMTAYRRFVAYTMEIIYLIVMIIGQGILELTSVTPILVVVLLSSITLSPILIDILQAAYDRAILYIEGRKQSQADRNAFKEGEIQ